VTHCPQLGIITVVDIHILGPGFGSGDAVRGF